MSFIPRSSFTCSISFYITPLPYTHRLKAIVLRWESLKNRINSVIINITGKPVITVSVLIEEDIVSPLRLRPSHVESTYVKTPERKEVEMEDEIQEVVQREVHQSPDMLPEMESEPVKEAPLEEAMAVDVLPESTKPGSTTPKEKKKRGSIMSRFSFKRSKRDSDGPKTPNTTPKKKQKKGAIVWNEQNVDGTLQQIRLSFHWVKFKLVRVYKFIDFHIYKINKSLRRTKSCREMLL